MITRMFISDLNEKGQVEFVRCRRCKKFLGRRAFAAHKRGCHVNDWKYSPNTSRDKEDNGRNLKGA